MSFNLIERSDDVCSFDDGVRVEDNNTIYSRSKKALFIKAIKSYVCRRLRFPLAVTSAPSIKEIFAITANLSRLAATALPLREALYIIQIQYKNKKTSNMLQDLAAGVASGERLSLAMSRHPGYFSDLYIKVVQLGEKNANLHRQFVHLTQHYKTKLETRSKLIKALSYPLTVISLAVAILFALLYFVVPSLGGLLSSTAESPSLPWIVVASTQLHEHISLILLAIVLLPLSFYFGGFLNVNKYFYNLICKLPFISRVMRMKQSSQWLYDVGISLKCGATLAECLQPNNAYRQSLSVNKKQHSPYCKSICRISREVCHGRSLHSATSSSGMFSLRDLSLISIAEKTSSLDVMLLEISQLLQTEFQELLESYIRWLQPLLLIFLSIIVAAMVAAIYLPLLQQGGQIG